MTATPVVKRAPAKKSDARPAITIRLSTATLKNIERAATRQKKGTREYLREYLEHQFELAI